MNDTQNPLHVAVVQQPMAWTTERNVAHIVDAIALAAGQGAQLCLFPELALTGFHRKIRDEAKPEIVEPALQRVRAACREAGVASLLGLPTFTDGAAVRNSYAFIDAAGEVGSIVHKNGLTETELTFFEPGSDRPVLRYAGRTCSTVMCREVEDVDAIAGQLAAEPVQLMFWPSIVGHPPGTIAEPEREVQDLGYVARAAAFARRLKTHLVQCNWPHTLNSPEARWQGHSKAYGPDGEVLLMLPRDEAGIGLFELGAREYRWLPLAA